jgi:hypothetical protein
LGNKGEDGYAINERLKYKTIHLIECGTADDWSFEEDFCRIKKDLRIYDLAPFVSNKGNMKRAFIILFEERFGYAGRIEACHQLSR